MPACRSLEAAFVESAPGLACGHEFTVSHTPGSTGRRNALRIAGGLALCAGAGARCMRRLCNPRRPGHGGAWRSWRSACPQAASFGTTARSLLRPALLATGAFWRAAPSAPGSGPLCPRPMRLQHDSASFPRRGFQFFAVGKRPGNSSSPCSLHLSPTPLISLLTACVLACRALVLPFKPRETSFAACVRSAPSVRATCCT
jgi:hypothetical protein